MDDLSNYKLQLQQVKAALSTDPENSELLKLKSDLEEVIELTQELIKTQLEEQSKTYIQPSFNYGLDGGASSSHDAATTGAQKYSEPTKFWKAGDKCMAKWTDGNYYDATIESITDDGEVNLMFDTYQNRGTSSLKELKERKVRGVEVFANTNNKRARPNQKEYLKKKKQKKQQRWKELEEAREQEKNKWLNFTAKTAKKTGSALPKSIFASPETVSGRVGIGTCGISGKGMTDFSTTEKYRKGQS